MGDVVKTVGGVADNMLGTNIFGPNSGDRALNEQSNATNSANQMAYKMYEQQRADQAPWREAGMGALRSLGDADFNRDFGMSDFQQDPGYQFRMGEGMKALERSAAARGGLGSGATLKALTKYGQDFASNEYQNAYNRFNADRDRRFNRLSSMAGLGQTATNQMGNAASNYGQQYQSNILGYGNAAASNQIAQGNKMGNMLQQGVGIAAMFSDERTKTDIAPVNKEDLAELKHHLKAYTFKYKNEMFGKGDWVGVMAQDLQKSKLGKSLLVEDEHGLLMVDMKKVMSLFLATLAEA